MASIKTIRHSLSHILASAIQEMHPGTKFGMGPAIENGFYYDLDLPQSLAPEALPAIEKRMKEIIKRNVVFKKKTVTKPEAKKIFKDQPYKLEIINDLSAVKTTIYESGEFTDLCKGPHVKSTREIPADSFKLARIAGAYWKGSEKNKMLTRVYGLAFENKKELDKYLKLQEEAEKRDHRFLGQKMDLFHIDENVGPGLILWHPKGAILKRIVMNYALEEYLKSGYQLVDTPHIGKLSLWKTSGHTDFYRENMLPPMRLAELGEDEKDDYQIKPMNCPFHIAIFKSQIRSYKDLPLRFTEMGTVYRYEKSGTLHGLVRVRQITQDDAHIFCTLEQLPEEIFSVMKFIYKILKDFGFNDFDVYLSTQPEKYVGEAKVWRKAENSLKYALNKLKLKYKTDKGGGAFYGPKIDIKIKDSLGRPWQCSTLQVDFNLPERFDVNYIDQNGKKQKVIMIHRALLGAIERFIGVLLEYYGGNLPLWLSPVQIQVIPVSEKHKKYAQEIAKKLANFRLELKDSDNTLGKKIREGELQKIPYLLIVGDREIKNKTVSVRERGKGDIGEIKIDKFIENQAGRIKITRPAQAKKRVKLSSPK